ncbi:hypothetical protein, partial [Nocardia seriolae]
CARRIRWRWFRGGLNYQAREPLLWIGTQSQQARNGWHSVCVHSSCAAQHLVAFETSESAAISQSHGAGEIVDEFVVEVLPGCPWNDLAVEVRGLSRCEERLLFEVGHSKVAVVPSQIGGSADSSPARFGGWIALVHDGDDHRYALYRSVLDRKLYRWNE